MSGINLGNVVGLIRGVTPPTKTYVIWGKIIDPINPNVVVLHTYKGVGDVTLEMNWKPLNTDSNQVYWDDIIDRPRVVENLAVNNQKLKAQDINGQDIAAISVEAILRGYNIDLLTMYNEEVGD